MSSFLLAAHEFDAPAVVPVEHRVFEQDVASRAQYDLRAHLLPALAWGEMTGFKKVTHVAVRQSIQVVGQVRAGIIHLAAPQKLPVELRRHFHAFSF